MSQKLEEVLKKMGFPSNNISEIIKAIPHHVYSFFDSLSSEELDEMIETLSYIYIAQNIRKEGVLETNCENENSVSLLRQFGFVENYDWYGLNVVRTLKSGAVISNKILEAKAKEIQPNDFIRFNPIAKTVLLSRIINNSFTLPIKFFNRDCFDSFYNEGFVDRLPYCSEFVFTECKILADELVRRGLGSIANNYFSTKGDQVREKCYVFSMEIADILKSELDETNSTMKDIESFGKVAEAKYKAINFLQQYDPQKYQGVADYRTIQMNLLDYLKQLGNCVVVSKGVFESGFGKGIPFIIKNDRDYKVALQSFKLELISEIEKEMKRLKELNTEPIKTKVKTTEKGIKEQESHKKADKKTPEKSGSGKFKADDIKVFLGNSEDGEDVYWYPSKLSNGHLIIIGGSGSGKTETIRVITSEINIYGYPVLLIDFHGDMGISGIGMKTYNIQEGSEYFFNPLELDPKFSTITPLKASSDFVDSIFINFPNIGIQQRDRLKDIIRSAYSIKGITSESNTWNKDISFKDIQQTIEESDDDTVITLKAYLGDIFAYELFTGTKKISISDIFSGISHFNLKNLPESLKALYADLLLRKLYHNLEDMGEIKRGAVTSKEKFRLFVIVDESKLLVSEKQGTKAVLNKYATELRKYGIVLILASQIIEHFNEEILSNIALKFCMKAQNKVQADKNKRYFDVNSETLMQLNVGEGIIAGLTEKKFKVKILATHNRNIN